MTRILILLSLLCGCHGQSQEGYCGDGRIDPGETCDGTAVHLQDRGCRGDHPITHVECHDDCLGETVHCCLPDLSECASYEPGAP